MISENVNQSEQRILYLVTNGIFIIFDILYKAVIKKVIKSFIQRVPVFKIICAEIACCFTKEFSLAILSPYLSSLDKEISVVVLSHKSLI